MPSYVSRGGFQIRPFWMLPNYVRCNLCGSDRTKVIFREKHALPWCREYILVRCERCGLFYANPQIAYDYSKVGMPSDWSEEDVVEALPPPS